MSGGYKYQWYEGKPVLDRDQERKKILDDIFNPWHKKLFCLKGIVKFILIPLAIFFLCLYLRSFFYDVK